MYIWYFTYSVRSKFKRQLGKISAFFIYFYELIFLPEEDMMGFEVTCSYFVALLYFFLLNWQINESAVYVSYFKAPPTDDLRLFYVAAGNAFTAKKLFSTPLLLSNRGEEEEQDEGALYLSRSSSCQSATFRTLCPSEESNKSSGCLNGGGAAQLSILCVRITSEHCSLSLPVKQTFEGFCARARLYFTISKTLSSYGWSKL